VIKKCDLKEERGCMSRSFPKVLVVDDDPNILAVVPRYLLPQGIKTEVATQIVDLCDCFVDKIRLKNSLAQATFKAIERFASENRLAA